MLAERIDPMYGPVIGTEHHANMIVRLVCGGAPQTRDEAVVHGELQNEGFLDHKKLILDHSRVLKSGGGVPVLKDLANTSWVWFGELKADPGHIFVVKMFWSAPAIISYEGTDTRIII